MAVVCLLAAAAVPSGSSGTGATGATTLRVLQMNLCNSGRADCYTGRSVTEAASVIRAEEPDLVTLNEVCQDDVTALERVFAVVHRSAVVSAFAAAGDRPSGDVTRCRNGQPYGVGLLTSIPAPYRGHTVHRGIHPTQDVDDPEERAWLCLHVAGVVNACTTHLAAFSSTVALAQCVHLLGTVVPAIRRSAGYAPTVLGGDLNLRLGGQPDVRACVPPGHLRVDDGAVQHIVTTADATVRSHRTVGMRGSTDHPGLLATLTIAGDGGDTLVLGPRPDFPGWPAGDGRRGTDGDR
ncbi:Endonuclease/Exonuclease/phosphatase family protein [Micromonospora nigra]|uniref:Endonuclease/Exonuclease/phosphatase family protein n=1 Tax=Micromonospora nigra TaxID=145857 RepID=A0A1C6RA40_9ACTN|nr:endonuclease/exonuclease/phosphatase family protein [Micromonospora nigra]SCL13985.1 Endonuclease/Exonuclease/phosphatase family protein [Micromonospora nigra]